MAIYLGNLELATGGGATGTVLPVNTYESFSVSGTGNPSGYNATTGLYTHPNGDYWLKTGNLLSGVQATYPSATVTPGSVLTQTSQTIPASNQGTGIARNKRAWNSTYFYEALLYLVPSTNRSKIARYNPTNPYAFVNAFNSPAAVFGSGGTL